MRRIDWRLIRPSRDGEEEGTRVGRAIVRLWQRVDDLEEGGPSETRLIEMEKRYETLTTSACEAASAPLISDDPDWETRMLEEYEYLDVNEDLEVFLASRSTDPDCERCPYASNYSLFPMDPCEFSAVALVEVVNDKAVGEKADSAMNPNEMMAYSDELQTVLSTRCFADNAAINAEDYLEKAISFLRFWANLGFAIEPAGLDERIFEMAETEEPLPSSEPTIH